MKSQLIMAICDADLTIKKEWVNKLRQRTVEEMVEIYENSDEYAMIKDIEERCNY